MFDYQVEILKIPSEYASKSLYQIIQTTASKKTLLINACWRWTFDDLCAVIEMPEDGCLWYYPDTAGTPPSIIDDEENYAAFVRWGKTRDKKQRKEPVRIDQEIGEILEEDNE